MALGPYIKRIRKPKIRGLWPFLWKRSVWQNPDQKRTNQNVGFTSRLPCHIINIYILFFAKRRLTVKKVIYRDKCWGELTSKITRSMPLTVTAVTTSTIIVHFIITWKLAQALDAIYDHAWRVNCVRSNDAHKHRAQSCSICPQTISAKKNNNGAYIGLNIL